MEMREKDSGERQGEDERRQEYDRARDEEVRGEKR